MTSIGGNNKKDKAKYFDENLHCFEEKRASVDTSDNKHVIYKNAKKKNDTIGLIRL